MRKIGHITRKSMLYQTRVEYGDWAMNHVQGCSHGCLYPCYAYLMARRFKRVESYEDWLIPFIVDNTLELLNKELPRYSEKINQVQLCFTTDPFMYGYQEIEAMSMDSISLINSFDIPCNVLTKGVLPLELSKYDKRNQYGITLVTLDEQYRMEMEPGAAAIEDRISALEALHNAGCKTWVSMEPYPTPNLIEQDVADILQRIKFVDRLVFGRTHYDKRTSSYSTVFSYYAKTAAYVENFCLEHGIDCHIKEGTR